MRDLPILESTLVDAEYQSGWPVHPDELPSPCDRVVIVEHRPRRDVWDADRLLWQREIAARSRRNRSKPLSLAEEYPQLQPSTPPKPRAPKPPRPAPRPAVQPVEITQPVLYCGAEGCRHVGMFRAINVADPSMWFYCCRSHRAESLTVWPEVEIVPADAP